MTNQAWGAFFNDAWNAAVEKSDSNDDTGGDTVTIKWTTTEPEEAGAYWFTGEAHALSMTFSDGQRPMVIENCIVNFLEGGWNMPMYFLFNLRGKWYGPLEPPREDE